MASSAHADDDTLDISSLDDYDSFDELTQESLSSFDAGQAAKSYWLGKKFMSLALAYNMLQAAGPEETAIDIDVKVEDSLRRWPYTRSLKTVLNAFESTLPHNLRSNTGEDYEAFMCAIGHIIRSATPNRPGIEAILESFCTEGEDWADIFEAKLGVGTLARATSLAGNKTETKESNLDYYKAVQAHCQRKGETLDKTSKPLLGGQSQGSHGTGGWKTTLTTATRSFEGKGRTLGESTRKAAKHAYAAFGLGERSTQR